MFGGLDRLKVDAAVVDSAVTMMTATTTSCLSTFPFLLTVVVVVAGQDLGGCVRLKDSLPGL
jgi:hypothetical protein